MSFFFCGEKQFWIVKFTFSTGPAYEKCESHHSKLYSTTNKTHYRISLFIVLSNNFQIIFFIVCQDRIITAHLYCLFCLQFNLVYSFFIFPLWFLSEVFFPNCLSKTLQTPLIVIMPKSNKNLIWLQICGNM